MVPFFGQPCGYCVVNLVSNAVDSFALPLLRQRN